MNARNNRFSQLGPVTGFDQVNWFSLHDLKTVDISNNNIKHDITDFLARLPSAKEPSNQKQCWHLQASHPPEASGIRELIFSNNLFSGEIDCSKQLILPRSKRGTIERFIGANNQIRGTLDPCFPAPLRELDLEYNQIKGFSRSHLDQFFKRSVEWYGGSTLTSIKLKSNRVHPLCCEYAQVTRLLTAPSPHSTTSLF